MIGNNYEDAYKEVSVIINNLKKEDYDKIPKKYIDFFCKNANQNYYFKYDKNKTLEEQNLLDDTKYIFVGLFEEFGATDSQKMMIKNIRIDYNNKLEEEKRKKYNPDDIFKKNVYPNIAKENMQIVEYNEEKWYQKIIEKILKMFRKK